MTHSRVTPTGQAMGKSAARRRLQRHRRLNQAPDCKFRYYITNTFDGCIEGTNDETKARDLAACPEYFVVDTHNGKWITDDGEVEVVESA